MLVMVAPEAASTLTLWHSTTSAHTFSMAASRMTGESMSSSTWTEAILPSETVVKTVMSPFMDASTAT